MPGGGTTVPGGGTTVPGGGTTMPGGAAQPCRGGRHNRASLTVFLTVLEL